MLSPTRVLSALLLSRQLRIPFPLVAITLMACLPSGGASHLPGVTSDEAVTVDRAVRAFMQTVSHSVTQDGPLAWIKYFDESPAFFMAVNGQMAFPNASAAQEGTRKFSQTIRHIELKWGMICASTRSPVNTLLWGSHGAKFKSTRLGIALLKRDILLLSRSIATDIGNSVTLIGPRQFRPTSSSRNNDGSCQHGVLSEIGILRQLPIDDAVIHNGIPGTSRKEDT